MKQNLLIFPILLITLLSFRYPQFFDAKDDTKGIIFHTGNWNEAIEASKSQNKLIFVEIYATWCGPCKKMKAKTFTNPNVGKFYNENFINVLMDGEKEEGAVLAKKYQVKGYPTFLFFDNEGKKIAETSGYHNTKEFLELGEKIKKGR
jgi:thioredoxin 1